METRSVLTFLQLQLQIDFGILFMVDIQVKYGDT